MYLTKTAHDYTNQQTLTWSTSKISDEYMPKDFFKPQNESEVPKNKFESDKVEIVSLVEKTQKIRAEVIAKDKTEIVINLAYFPGWHVFIDGEQVWFKYSNKGLIVAIPKGKHTVEVIFSQTSIEKVANGVTLSGVFILFLGIIIFQRKETKHAKTTT